MTFRKGDKIRVTGRIDDYDPIPVGTTGTVRAVLNEGSEFEQVSVKWDEDRSLLLLPEDYHAVEVLR